MSFHTTRLFLHPLKTSENLWFSDVFRGHRMRRVAWNDLIKDMLSYAIVFIDGIVVSVLRPLNRETILAVNALNQNKVNKC